MKKQTLLALLAITLLATVVISACGGQAAVPTETLQAPPAPATQTQALPQPTQPPAATDTSVPATEITASAEEPAATNVSFTNDIMPILENRCIDCHGGSRTREGLDMKTHGSLLNGSNNGPVVTPGNADGSLLVELIVKGDMPNRGPKVTPDELQLIMDWVNQGALNN